MTSFKNYVTANIQGLVVKALDQFCQDRDRECRAIQGTPETAFLGASVGNENAIIPFVANDDTSFILNCSATDNDQASCFLSQRPGSILPKWLSEKIGGSGIWACDSRSVPLIDTKVVIVADCGAADGGSHADGSVPVADVAVEVDAAILDGAELPPEDMSVEDAADGAADLAGDVTDTDGVVIPPDMSTDDASDAEDAIQDAAADLAGDATAADGTELPPDMSVDDTADVEDTAQDAGTDLSGDTTVADGVPTPPEDASVDASIQDAAADVVDDTSDAAVPICQYQWQCPDTSDASLPADVTMSVIDAGVSNPVYSQLCGGIGGALSMAAPVNSAIVACTNNTINALMSGGKSCVAECAFFDSIGITLSTDPADLDLLAPTFFDKNWNPKPEVVLTLKAPIMSDGFTPAFPDAMGKSYKFTYNIAQSFASGIDVWNAKDKDAGGNPMFGKITLEYQWANIITKNPGALDITFEGPTISGKAQYHYPCSTLVDEQGVPNAIIQCTEVK